MQITLGADPELWVQNPNTGKFVNAAGLIQGDKKNPFKVNKGAVQVDGMALEFNIDPASSCEEFLTNIREVRQQLEAMVPGYNVIADPVADFDQDYFDAQPEDCKVLGCDPDYNAWTGLANDPPDPGKPFRTASGHIHIGWGEGFNVTDETHFTDCRAVAKQLDYYLGVNSLLWDPDNRRRELYGKAGAFRPKPYGMEYRVLSSTWLRSPLLTKWVYNAAVRGTQDLLKGVCLEDQFGNEAQQIIDNNETGWADRVSFIDNFPPPPSIARKVA